MKSIQNTIWSLLNHISLLYLTLNPKTKHTPKMVEIKLEISKEYTVLKNFVNLIISLVFLP